MRKSPPQTGPGDRDNDPVTLNEVTGVALHVEPGSVALPAALPADVTDAPDLASLQDFQFLIQWSVVAFHFVNTDGVKSEWFRNWIGNGYMVVNAYFLLSGMLLSLVLHRGRRRFRIEGWTRSAYIEQEGFVYESYTRFLWQRCVRIYPLFWVALLISLVANWPQWRHQSLWQIGLVATLTQAWVPTVSMNPVLNGPAWFLSVVMTFYVLFPLFLYVLLPARRLSFGAACCRLAVLYGLCLALGLGFQRYWGHNSPFKFFPPVRLVECAMGVVLGRLLHDQWSTLRDLARAHAGWLRAVSIAAAVTLSAVRAVLPPSARNPLYPFVVCGLLDPVHALRLVVRATGVRSELDPGLGRYAYALYVLQAPVHAACTLLVPGIRFVYYAPVLLAVAVALHHAVEAPLLALRRDAAVPVLGARA